MIFNANIFESDEVKELYKLEDTLREYLGDTGLLDEILRALTFTEEKDILEFIARRHDVDVDEDK